ncbi:hypothetical protein [Clostridium estertheticum]|uniref:hypothetical protein n=1 Tax=Clostridium estertheticum TaxID=238834 RepID=UPI001CF3CC7D|nr:hypothetical protein [Clostridium estertheticum]MCB2358709.1 hypothetical protein [Clostridium estertheticum]
MQLNKASENLSLEKKGVFDDIVVYVRTSNIKTRDAEEFLEQILDSFLNAEHQGVSIGTVLGTTDIKHYCEEIVDTFKSSYNYLSYFSTYVMYTGMIVTILSIINYITQSVSIISKYGVNTLTFYLNFNLGIISQFCWIFNYSNCISHFNKTDCANSSIYELEYSKRKSRFSGKYGTIIYY